MAVGPPDFAARVRRARPIAVAPVQSGKSGAMRATWRDGTVAIVKVSRERLPNGKVAQRGIPAKDHPYRELAFKQLAEAFGWGDLVPQVVLFKLGGLEASAQAFIPAGQLREFDSRLEDTSHKRPWVRGLREVAKLAPADQWRRLTLLDLVAGSRDRHANNVGLRTLVDGDAICHKLVAWDNAVTFGDTFRLYHNVFHKYLFRHSMDVAPVWNDFSALGRADLDFALSGLVPPEEIEHAWLRRQFVMEYPYKLPWKVLSRGHDSPKDFPARESFFREGMESDFDDTKSDFLYVEGDLCGSERDSQQGQIAA